jgi:uncharacterized protein YraI
MQQKLILAAMLAGAALFNSQSAIAGSYAVTEINMRAGPSTHYPSIGILPEGISLHVFGCTKGYRWCDVEASGRRGWVSAAYIDVDYDAHRVRVPVYVREVDEPTVPTVSFNINTYWSSHYSDYEFYHEMNSWDDYDWEADAPPPGWDPQW